MSFGVITNYSSLIETRRTEARDVNPLDRHGGIKLETGSPQPRLVKPERPPELTSIQQRAPYKMEGKLVTPEAFRYEPNPDTPLGKLRNTVIEQRRDQPELFDRCYEGLKLVSQGCSLMKSPPEYPGAQEDYAAGLREQAGKLMAKAEQLAGHEEANRIPISDTGEMLGAKMDALLRSAAKDLEDLAKYVESLPDPRPSLSTVGHFKALEVSGAIKVIDDAIDAKEAAMANVEPNSPEALALQGDLEILVSTKQQLSERRDTFDGKIGDGWTDTEPLSKKQFGKLMGEKLGFFAKLMAKLPFSSIATERRLNKQAIERGGMPLATASKLREGEKLAMVLSDRLSKANVAGDHSLKALGKEIHHKHVEVLSNEQNWGKIDKNFSVTINGQVQNFNSTLTPANQLDGIGGTFAPGTGVCCHDGSSDRAVNLWKSELKDEDGNVMFRQVRTGVNCAYEIEDEGLRKETNLSRVKDVVVANIGADPKLYQAALEQAKSRQEGNDDPQPIVLRNVWVSHLTPDPIRDMLAGGGVSSSNERLMSREQNEAMQTLSNNGMPFDIEMLDRDNNPITVKVQYEPMMFSFGVNAGAVSMGGFDLLGGWSVAHEEFNAPSMEKLIGLDAMNGGNKLGGWVNEAIEKNNQTIQEANVEIGLLNQKLRGFELGFHLEPRNQGRFDWDAEVDGARLAELTQSSKHARESNDRIVALATQVKDLWISKDFEKQGADPYKMSSRIELLGFEIEAAVTSNCKSNKDRNSYADAHTKDLSISLRNRGELRGPDQPRSREEQINLRTISRECGNSELQALNVGGSGYKLDGVKQVYVEQGLSEGDVGYRGFGPYTAT